MLEDTIHAVSTPKGSSVRAVIRVSGPEALGMCRLIVPAALPRARAVYSSRAVVCGHAVPCQVLVMPAPRSFTGEDVVELHHPPFVEVQVSVPVDTVCHVHAWTR